MPKHLTPDEKLLYAMNRNDEATLAKALALGADPDARDRHGRTAIKMAAAQGNDAALRMLVAAGANVDAKCNEGWTPAMAASSESGLMDLIAAGADLDAVNDKGSTAAMVAAGCGRDKCLRALIAAGVDLESRDHDGTTAASHASIGGHHALASLIEVHILSAHDSSGPRLGAAHPSLRAAGSLRM